MTVVHAARPVTVLEWAQRYIDAGFQVVPLVPGTKRPPKQGGKDDAQWINLVFKASDFNPTDNIGLRSVNGLIVVDEDCPEAVAVADVFLPGTGAIYGRPSKPRSKRLYTSKFDKIVAFKDTELNENLIEIRVNHQDMAPPSVHPDGEVLAWDVGAFGEPATVEKEVLLRAVQLVATTALIARYYNPPGGRHDWCLALAGTLRGFGITCEEALKVVAAAGKYARDPKLDDRATEIRSTYNRLDGDSLKGMKDLRELSQTGKTFVPSLQRIWAGSQASGFVLDAKGEKILPNSQENVRRALTRLGVVVSHDGFANRMLLARGERDPQLFDDKASIDLYLTIDERFHFRPSRDFFDMVVKKIAWDNERHPVREWLGSLTWDTKPRLDRWLVDYAGAADTPYTRAVGALVLLAAVRRVRKPGSKFDELVVLESKQGTGKSSALQALCANPDWFSDDLPLNVDAKQTIERTGGKWLVEASELQGLRQGDIEHLKSFLSRQVDGPVRLAYDRIPSEVARQFVLIGTTNALTSYLKDPTGSRRFWPVAVDRFDVERLRADRNQIWAEAAAREAAGASIRLPESMWADAARQQEERRQADPWEELVESLIETLSIGGHPPTPPPYIEAQQIWEALGMNASQRNPQHASRVAAIMQRLRFTRKEKRYLGEGITKHRATCWIRDGAEMQEELFEANESGS